MKKNMNITDIAVIFKLKVTNKGLEYTPVKVAFGIYDNQNKEFIDNTGTPQSITSTPLLANIYAIVPPPP